MFNTQTIIRLIDGIQSIVSESRSSLSVKDVDHLKDCITFLETVRDTDNPRSPTSNRIVASVIEILLRVLFSDDIDKIKDLFF
jgi:hypothetical protein